MLIILIYVVKGRPVGKAVFAGPHGEGDGAAQSPTELQQRLYVNPCWKAVATTLIGR